MIRILIILPLALLSIVGCGEFKSKNSNNVKVNCTNNNCDSLYEVKPHREYGVINFRQIYPNYKSCLNLTDDQAASSKSLIASKIDSLPKEGKIDSMSAPTLMNLMQIAANFCKNTLDKEKGGARYFFSGYNLEGSTDSAAANSSTSARRLAEACWGRPITNSESTEITGGLTTAGLANVHNEKSALYLCTMILSSVEAIKF